MVAGNILTVTAVNSGTLMVGDAIPSVSNTRIMSQLTGTTGGIGTYTVCNITGSPWTCGTQLVASNTFNVGPSANFYIASRQPTTSLSASAQICGGVCAFLDQINQGTDTPFNLSSITTGDDWASGFACMSGVDPDQIKILGTVVSKRSNWSEPVQ